MCFSEKASWGAFALGAAGVVAGMARGAVAEDDYERRVRTGLSVALLFLVAMQLFEALMWRGLRVNLYAMVSNLLQPLALGALVLALTWDYEHPRTNDPDAPSDRPRSGVWYAALAALVLYVLSVIPYLPRAWRATAAAPVRSLTDCGADGGACRLEWAWTKSEVGVPGWVWSAFLLSILMSALLVRPWSTGVTLACVMAATLVLAHAVGKPVGSKWCFFAILLPVLVAAMPIYGEPDTENERPASA